MKKTLLNIGNALSKSEQRQINGGFENCMTLEECLMFECPDAGECQLFYDGPVGGLSNPCYRCDSRATL